MGKWDQNNNDLKMDWNSDNNKDPLQKAIITGFFYNIFIV